MAWQRAPAIIPCPRGRCRVYAIAMDAWPEPLFDVALAIEQARAVAARLQRAHTPQPTPPVDDEDEEEDEGHSSGGGGNIDPDDDEGWSDDDDEDEDDDETLWTLVASECAVPSRLAF